VDHVERKTGASELVQHGVAPVELLRCVRVVGLVGDGQVGEDAFEAELVRVAIDSASALASVASQPTRCIPVSTFRCTGSGSAPVSATALARRRCRKRV
jgi:hypothetical protein